MFSWRISQPHVCTKGVPTADLAWAATSKSGVPTDLRSAQVASGRSVRLLVHPGPLRGTLPRRTAANV